MSNDEYIIKEAEPIEWQKWLNQWKHEFIIDIIDSHFVTYPLKTTLWMCIKRRKLGGV
jgi:hypothetical protein